MTDQSEARMKVLMCNIQQLTFASGQLSGSLLVHLGATFRRHDEMRIALQLMAINKPKLNEVDHTVQTI